MSLEDTTWQQEGSGWSLYTESPVSAWECMRPVHPKWTRPSLGSHSVPGSVPAARDKEMNRIGYLLSRDIPSAEKTKLLCNLL